MVFVMIVTLEIRDECVAEFLEIMKADAVGSRTEPGCVRFDLLQSGPNTFVLYEAYENDAAAVAGTHPRPTQRQNSVLFMFDPPSRCSRHSGQFCCRAHTKSFSTAPFFSLSQPPPAPFCFSHSAAPHFCFPHSAAHKETEHYKAWSAFKAREPSPVLSQYVAKSKAVDFTC